MKRNQNSRPDKQQKQEWLVVIYIWMIGLFFFAYLASRMILDAYPHQFHWLALPIGLSGALSGIPLGWLWYRWRGDVI